MARRLLAEGLGTALLLAAVVGSGIMGERLAGGHTAVALLANALATGATLAALVLAFGHVSGAHFNPVVTIADAVRNRAHRGQVPGYLAAQVVGAVLGVVGAHAMFGEPLVQWSSHVRSGGPQIFSEFIATFGLLAVILGCSSGRHESVPFAVGAYIIGAYWFTASTSFANPAVTAARTLTDTFSGVRAVDAPGFISAQFAGAALAAVVMPWLARDGPPIPASAPDSKDSAAATRRQRVLILCTGNSARSQMAEGLLRSFGRGRFEVVSAGTKPGIVRAEAIAVMAEFGIDISSHRSKHVGEFDGQRFDYVMTVCDQARETCPVFPGPVTRLHWSFSDPAAVNGDEAERLEAFRGVRDALAATLLAFVAGRVS